MVLNFNDIEWEVMDTVVAKRFANFWKQHEHTSKEIYFMGETQTQIKDEIDKACYMLGLQPSDDMNKLHEIFADNRFPTEELSRLNNLIHYYELAENGFPPRWGYMFGDPNAKMELFPADYEEFTLTREFGTLYINYSHVGKHFAEIVYSYDYDIKKEQYRPQEYARPSFMCWLGEPIDEKSIRAFNVRVENARQLLQERLDLPEQGDPALRVGYIPFAKLKTRINNSELVNHLLKAKGNNKNYMELFDNG